MISIRWPETTNTHDFTDNVHRVRKRERTLVSVYTKQRRITFVSSTTNADVDYDKTFLRMSDSTSHPWNSSLGLFPRCSPAASCKTLSLSLYSFRPCSLADYAPLHNIIVYLALSAVKQRQPSALEFASRARDKQIPYCLYYVLDLRANFAGFF